MFTGIVEGTGKVAKLKRFNKNLRIHVDADFVLGRQRLGESVSVSGVCLTAVSFGKNSFAADIGLETLRVTTMGGLRRGSVVNLERPLRLSDRLGGHMVQGHVDGLGTIARIDNFPEGREFWIRFPKRIGRYIIAKGSISVEGVSLTVNQLWGDKFSVFLIPHTLEVTNLGVKKVGDCVNLEVDIIGKYMERLLVSK